MNLPEQCSKIDGSLEKKKRCFVKDAWISEMKAADRCVYKEEMEERQREGILND